METEEACKTGAPAGVSQDTPASSEEQVQQRHSNQNAQHLQQATPIDCRKKVLIAIDNSKHSDRALRWYAVKLHTPGDQVLFLNVAEPPELALGFGMAGPAVADIYTKAMEETIAIAKQLAASVKDTCRSLGIEKVRFLERIGHGPGQAIVEVAEEEQVDLIVLGSRGVGLLRRTFLGSVSDYVLHHSRHAAITVVPAQMPCVQCHLPECSAHVDCPYISKQPPGTAGQQQQQQQHEQEQHADCKME